MVMDVYGGMINNSKFVETLGFKGRVNPIAVKTGLRQDIRRALEVRERDQFIGRYKWVNLEKYGIQPKMLERILYYRGRIVAFKLGDKFATLPFALNGTINMYGQYNSVTPLTFNGSIYTDEDGKEGLDDGILIPDLKLYPCYDIGMTEGKDCVILNDYSQGLSEAIEPRHKLNLWANEELSNIVVLIRHNYISSAATWKTRVLDEGQKQSLLEEFADYESDVLEYGRRIFGITSNMDLQEMFSTQPLQTQEYWECYVSMDNLRENLMGIENNGIFKKKERQLKGEMELEASSADLLYDIGLSNRQEFCEIFNTIFGTDIACEMSSTIAGEMEEEQNGETNKCVSNESGDE